MPEEQSKFEGWAKVEVMGHQTHIGFVTTEVYGAAVLFRVDQPPFEEREFTLTKPSYKSIQTAENLHSSQWWPAGTKMKRAALPPATVLVGSQSIYRITPCTEEAARLAIEQAEPRPLILVEVPAGVALPAPVQHDEDDEDDEDNEYDPDPYNEDPNRAIVPTEETL